MTENETKMKCNLIIGALLAILIPSYLQI